MDPTAWTEAGLYDPDAPHADDRLAVLEYLSSIGVTLEQMIASVETNELTTAGVDMLLRQGDLTGPDVAARAGTGWDTLAEIYRLVGVAVPSPDSTVFDERDVSAMQLLLAGTENLEGDLANEVMRALGSSLSNLAETAVMLFVGSLEEELDRPGQQLTRAEAATTLVQLGLELGPAMGTLFRHHLRDAVARQRRSMADGTTRRLARVGVGFMDVVGFTGRSLEMDPDELLSFVRSFEERTYDVVSRSGGRVVKHIGDAVMFSTIDPTDACSIALGLAVEFERSGSTPRGGVAFGPVVARHGDLYGPTVNLAARLADAAVPGEVLTTEETAAAAAAGPVAFEPAGKRQLKGFDHPVRVMSIEAPDRSRPSDPGD